METVNQELASISKKIQQPIRDAIKAAQILKVDIPEQYLDSIKNSNGERSNGKFMWQVEGHKPRRSHHGPCGGFPKDAVGMPAVRGS